MFSTSRPEIYSWNESWLLERIPVFTLRPKEKYSSWNISPAFFFLTSLRWFPFLLHWSSKKSPATSLTVKAWEYGNIICLWFEPEYCIAVLWNHDCITKLRVLMEKWPLKPAFENTLNNSLGCDCFTTWIFRITARNTALPFSPPYSLYSLEWH